MVVPVSAAAVATIFSRLHLLSGFIALVHLALRPSDLHRGISKSRNGLYPGMST